MREINSFLIIFFLAKTIFFEEEVRVSTFKREKDITSPTHHHRHQLQDNNTTTTTTMNHHLMTISIINRVIAIPIPIQIRIRTCPFHTRAIRSLITLSTIRTSHRILHIPIHTNLRRQDHLITIIISLTKATNSTIFISNNYLINTSQIDSTRTQTKMMCAHLHRLLMTTNEPRVKEYQ